MEVNQTVISFEKFNNFIGAIQTKDEKMCRISEVLGDVDELFSINCLDEAVELLSLLCDDVDGDIPYWMWELNYGKDWKPGYVLGPDGVDIKLQTVRDLYDYLCIRAAPEEPADRTVFSVESELYNCPCFELTYHADTGKYSMSIETIFKMDRRETGQYLMDILDQFTAWMLENGYKTTELLDLWEVFEHGLNIHSEFDKVEDAYAVFYMLVIGSTQYGIKSGSWQ